MRHIFYCALALALAGVSEIRSAGAQQTTDENPTIGLVLDESYEGRDRYGKVWRLIQIDIGPGEGNNKRNSKQRTRVVDWETGTFIEHEIYIMLGDGNNGDIVYAPTEGAMIIARRGDDGFLGAFGAYMQEKFLDRLRGEGEMTTARYWMMDNLGMSQASSGVFDVSNPSLLHVIIIALTVVGGIGALKKRKKAK